MKLFKFLAVLAILSFNSAYAEEKKMEPNLQKATFAGGCFWCMQPIFDGLEGVVETSVGYSGGTKEDANYEAVSTKKTEHKEAINITYDPSKITYEKLLDKFMKNIDPVDPLGQFADKGPQYKTAIYYHNAEQKIAAEKYFKELIESKVIKGEIVTEIEPYKNFFDAEEYHQEYYKKKAVHYNLYKYGSGRPAKLKKIWGEEASGE